MVALPPGLWPLAALAATGTFHRVVPQAGSLKKAPLQKAQCLKAVHLCVEQSLVQTVQQEGFVCHARSQAAVAPSVLAAVEGYRRWHKEPHAVFRIRTTPGMQVLHSVLLLIQPAS